MRRADPPPLGWARLAALLLGTLGLGAQASAPAEQVACTLQPPSAWMGEQKIRALFGEQDYTMVQFKVSRTHCYEFYAIHKDGSIVEAYYDPVTGERVKYLRIQPDGRLSRTAPAGAAAASAPSR